MGDKRSVCYRKTVPGTTVPTESSWNCHVPARSIFLPEARADIETKAAKAVMVVLSLMMSVNCE